MTAQQGQVDTALQAASDIDKELVDLLNAKVASVGAKTNHWCFSLMSYSRIPVRQQAILDYIKQRKHIHCRSHMQQTIYVMYVVFTLQL